MFTLCIYIAVLVFIALIFIFQSTVKTRLGKPPVGSLIIAYKYSKGGFFRNIKFFSKDVFSLNSLNTIRIYYSDSGAKCIEYAQGVILKESEEYLDNNLFLEVKRNGFSFMKTPAISHAIYIVFPVFLCLPITKIFAVLVGYPRIRRFSEEQNLCAYPMLEIYSKHSIALIAPLMQQDEFVVLEAEKIVYGREFSVLCNSFSFLNTSGLQNDDRNKVPEAVQDSTSAKKTPKLVKRETKG